MVERGALLLALSADQYQNIFERLKTGTLAVLSSTLPSEPQVYVHIIVESARLLPRHKKFASLGIDRRQHSRVYE